MNTPMPLSRDYFTAVSVISGRPHGDNESHLEHHVWLCEGCNWIIEGNLDTVVRHLHEDSGCYGQRLWLLEERLSLGRLCLAPSGLMCHYDPAHGGTELLLLQPVYYPELLRLVADTLTSRVHLQHL
jgi:hypothetical protein